MASIVEDAQHGTNSGIGHLLVIDGFAVNIVLIDNGPGLLEQVSVVRRLVVCREQRACIDLMTEPTPGKRDEQQSNGDSNLAELPAGIPPESPACAASIAVVSPIFVSKGLSWGIFLRQGSMSVRLLCL